MTDEEREDLNTFKHDLVKQARWWQWKAETLEKEKEQLKAENAALRERLSKAVELKAKRLDVIYMPWVYDGNFDIATLQIIGIDLRTNGEIAYITNLESDSIIYLAKYSYGIFYNADFDHIVFTDRSKAEVRLAELKGEER